MTRFLAGPLLAVEEPYEAGPTALFVIVLLGIGIIFLARSMLKHLRRVPPTFDAAEPGDPSPATQPPQPTESPGDKPAPPERPRDPIA